MLVFLIGATVTVFVWELGKLWLSGRPKKLADDIDDLVVKGYFKLKPDDFMCKTGFKILHDPDGTTLFVQHTPYGFITRHYTSGGDFINEAYHEFDRYKDTPGVPSDLPEDAPVSR